MLMSTGGLLLGFIDMLWSHLRTSHLHCRLLFTDIRNRFRASNRDMRFVTLAGILCWKIITLNQLSSYKGISCVRIR